VWWQHALKKRHNGKNLLPYEDRLRGPEYKLLYRILARW
jgi:hypothetical protein